MRLWRGWGPNPHQHLHQASPVGNSTLMCNSIVRPACGSALTGVPSWRQSCRRSCHRSWRWSWRQSWRGGVQAAVGISPDGGLLHNGRWVSLEGGFSEWPLSWESLTSCALKVWTRLLQRGGGFPGLLGRPGAQWKKYQERNVNLSMATNSIFGF